MGTKKISTISSVAKSIASISTAIVGVKPALDAVSDFVDKSKESKNELVSVPNLYPKEYQLNTNQAVKMLDDVGLKPTLVEATINDIDAKYRNCFDLQVIGTMPKANKKVEKGAPVIVKYITQDIIDECQKAFELLEEKKAEKKQSKKVKSIQRKQKTKQVVFKTVNITKKSIKKAPTVLKRKKNDIEEEV